MRKSIMRFLGAALGTFAAFVSVANAAPADGVRQAVQAQAQINDAAAKSQQVVNQVSDDAAKLLEEYLTVQHGSRFDQKP